MLGSSWTTPQKVCKLSNNCNRQKVTLSRHQIERLAVLLTLTKNVESVTIEESHKTGIGASHRAVYHTAKLERAWQEEITDVSNW